MQCHHYSSRREFTYGTLGVLFPKMFERERYWHFILWFVLLLLFSSVLVQRSIMLFIVEGKYLPYRSEQFFHISELMNTILDVMIASLVPLASKLFFVWRNSRSKIEELTSLNLNLASSARSQFFFIKEGSVNHKIYFSEIRYIESMRNYVRIKTKEKELVSNRSISSMQELVPKDSFLRVHRSFIVNLTHPHLASFTSRFVTIGGTKIPIGRMYKSAVEESLVQLHHSSRSSSIS